MKIDIRDIEEAVCLRFKISHDQICGPRRDQKICRPRWVVMALARELTSLSQSQIGKYLGGRDHTTVFHGCNRIRQLQAENPKVAAYVEECKAAIVPKHQEKLRAMAIELGAISIRELERKEAEKKAEAAARLKAEEHQRLIDSKIYVTRMPTQTRRIMVPYSPQSHKGAQG